MIYFSQTVPEALEDELMDDDFFECLIEQVETEEIILDQVQEEAYIEQAQEDAMIDAAIEQAEEDAMIDAYLEQAEEDAMIDAYLEQAAEDAMMDAAIEQAEEDAMIEEMASNSFRGSIPDRQVDSWIAIYNNLSCKSAEDINRLEVNNLLCFIHKKFERISQSGKTAYFSYRIIGQDKNATSLKIGNYFCNGSEQEHWVSWEYDNDEIKEKHFFTLDHINSHIYRSERTFIYPIEYSFASQVPLNNFNPFKFSFRKLNFMTKSGITACGDKLSRVKIFYGENKFLELSIFDFENNIIPLLNKLNDSASIVDFVIKIHLEQSVKYLEIIEEESINLLSNSQIRGAKNIIENVENLLEKLSRYLPLSIKSNSESDYCILLAKFNLLVKHIQKI